MLRKFSQRVKPSQLEVLERVKMGWLDILEKKVGEGWFTLCYTNMAGLNITIFNRNIFIFNPAPFSIVKVSLPEFFDGF